MSVRDNECTQGVEEIENSELRKIAEEVLGNVKYSFATIAVNSGQSVASNSLESDFKGILKTFKSEELAVIKQNAQILVDMPEVGRKAIFGRVGTLDKSAFIAKGGFAKVSEFMDIKSPLKIDAKLLGVKRNSVNVPVHVLKPVTDGLLIPTVALPSRWKAGFESVEEERAKNFESALESDIFDETKLADIWGINSEDMYNEADTEIDDFEEQALSSHLSLYIRKVKCVDETNPEFWGHDEIALAGVEIDENGDTKKISERYIGGGFDDGDSKRYNPPLRYANFSILEGGNKWPKKYTVTYLLAEKDHGGLSTALHKLWAKIKDKVKELLARGMGYILPADIAKYISIIVSWIINKLVGWIVNGLKDDIFPPQIVHCTLWGRNQRFYHGRYGDCDDYRNYSKTYTSHFYGHGGHYLIDYYWKLA